MALVTKQNMIEMFGETELVQLTSKGSDIGVIDDTVLTRAIDSAIDIAASYIGAAYTLPLPINPPVLIPYICDIARYSLYDQEPTEHVKNRYDAALSWFSKLARGEVTLALPKTDTPASTVVVASSRPQVFTDSVMDKMAL